MRKEPDYYTILGVDPSATSEELRARRNRLVRELHPDRHAGDPAYLERLTEINIAFHELRDEFRRRAYDRRRREATVRPVVQANYNMTAYSGAAPVRAARPSVRPDYHGVRRPVVQPKATHKRQALIGAIFAAVAACVIVLGLLAFSNMQPSPSSYIPHPSQPSPPVVMPVENTSGDAFLDAQETYQRKLTNIISDAQATVEAASATAEQLEDDGYASKAAKLRDEVTDLETKLLDAGDEVRKLGAVKDNASEANIESKLDQRLASLQTFDHRIDREQENDRSASLPSPSVVSKDDGGPEAPPPVDSDIQSSQSTP